MALPTINIPNFAGASTAVPVANSGRNAAADSSAIVLSTEDLAAVNALATALATANTALASLVTLGNSTAPSAVILPGKYATVAASATAQALGSGAIGDYLSHVTIIPATTSPGAISIKDGAGSAITIFAGGASSVSNLVPFPVPLGLISTAGGWTITTGTNVSAIAEGKF